MSNIHHFLGVDPQQSRGPKACDGAMVGGAAVDLRKPGTADFDRLPLVRDFEFLFHYARGIRGITSRQWSGFIHAQHPRWGWSNIMLDPGAGGGGINLVAELADPEQDLVAEMYRDPHREIDVVTSSRRVAVSPIITRDAASAVGGLPVLSTFDRGDAGIRFLWNDGSRPWTGDDIVPHLANEALAGALSLGQVAIAPGFTEVPAAHHAAWPQERVEILKCLGAVVSQLGKIGVATRETEDGPRRIYSARGTLVYQYPPRKDFAMAALMCYAGFLVWLKWVQLGMESGDGSGGGRPSASW